MSTAFPSALDTSTTLYDLVNNAQAALSAGYTAGGTTLDLDSAALFPATGGIIYVGNERTTYTGKTSNHCFQFTFYVFSVLLYLFGYFICIASNHISS